ncbi:MAG: hypothetical protein IT179_17850 [Acidobacteria bacterium]|nr:hypothetical protein [Acidobacteriota bacterium]
MTTVTVKADVDRGLLLKTLPDEVRHTVALYLEGKILQWYSRADGRGVVFVLNCRTAAEAKALTDDTPLAKAGLAGYDYVELSPLRPLGLLTGPSAPARSPQP